MWSQVRRTLKLMTSELVQLTSFQKTQQAGEHSLLSALSACSWLSSFFLSSKERGVFPLDPISPVSSAPCAVTQLCYHQADAMSLLSIATASLHVQGTALHHSGY